MKLFKATTALESLRAQKATLEAEIRVLKGNASAVEKRVNPKASLLQAKIAIARKEFEKVQTTNEFLACEIKLLAGNPDDSAYGDIISRECHLRADRISVMKKAAVQLDKDARAFLRTLQMDIE